MSMVVKMIEKMLQIYKKQEEIINYLLMGILTTVVNIVIKWILLYTILDARDSMQLQIAIVISWICAVVFAYVTNRIYVFKSKNKNIIKEILNFFSARVLTLILEMGIMWFFITLLKLDSNLWVIIWTVIVQTLIIILNYFFSKLFIFKTTKSC